MTITPGASSRRALVEGRLAPDEEEAVARPGQARGPTGELLLEGGLTLIELNPVLVYERGAVVVDALAAAGRA
jgi:hypothetical protein